MNDMTIILSIMMRTLINIQKYPSSASNLKHLENKLTKLEKKFHRKHKTKYQELFEATKSIWKETQDRHSKEVFVHELFFGECFSRQRIQFVKAGVSETVLNNLYLQYCDENSFQDEQSTFTISKDIFETTEKYLASK